MISRVFMICDAYESGMGHGLKMSIHSRGQDLFEDPELIEAYNTGYKLGFERATGK